MMISGTDFIQRKCLSCGTDFNGRYCHQCGEKILEPKERTVAYFFTKVFNAITLVDSKFLKTLWIMVRHPGQLSKEYVLGRRKPHFNLVTLFFALNLIYFLFPVFETFNTSYKSQISYQKYSSFTNQLVQSKIDEMGIEEKEYESRFNLKSNSMAKILLIVLVFLISVPLFLIFYSKNRLYADHVVFSFEYLSFNLLVNTILLSIILLPLVHISRYTQLGFLDSFGDGIPTIIALITNIYFLYFGVKIFYDRKTHWAIIQSLLMIPGFFYSLILFRLILFFVTYWQL